MLFISILILIMVMAIPSLKTRISPVLFQRMSSIILIYAGALSLNALYIQSIGSGIGLYSGLFHVTFISQLIEIFIYIIGAAILIAIPLYVNVLNTNTTTMEENNYKNSIEYCLLIMFSTLGASLLISSSNLISMYLSIELQSFAVYILSTIYRNSESATSAGLKYFLLGSLASCFILLGSGLIYTFTGLTNLESIYNLISVTEALSNNINQGIALGFIFILAGFLLKIAAAPLHNWAPDVYDESPTIVTIWLTIMPKISILIFILEIFTQITSVSPIIVSLNIIGINTIINLFIFYIIQYTITNLNTFLILLAIGYIINNNTNIIKGSEKDIKYISELKGLFFSNPILSISLTICLLSMAGTPPLLGFFSKQFVLYSAIESGYYFMAMSGILVSIISASYYLRIIRILHTETELNKSLIDETNTTVANTPSSQGISNIHSLLISSLTLLILFFVLKPSILLKSTQLLSLSLYFN